MSALTLASLAACVVAADDGDLRINQIQVVGTHNSYRVAPHPNVMGLVAAAGKGHAEGLDYSHRPFAEQFSALKIRQIELDLFADPKGGHYADPAARKILRAAGKEPGPDPNDRGQIAEPGFKVFHVQDIDYQSHAPTFIEALKQVREWSRANPRHVPILILVEMKDEAIAALPTRPVPIDAATLDAVDAEILSVFDRKAIVAPDDVRGDGESLPNAIRSRGWPTVESSRGKVMFALDNEGRIRDEYLAGHPALNGRIMFATVEPTDPAAAFFKVNDPVKDFDRIRSLIEQGFVVRTRADADTVEARRNDPARRDKALASGAQFVSTDYPQPRAEFSGYQVRLAGGVAARLNPVSGPDGTAGEDIEGTTTVEPVGK